MNTYIRNKFSQSRNISILVLAIVLLASVNVAQAAKGKPSAIVPVTSYTYEFKAIDLDKSGGISLEEAARDYELYRVFTLVDTNDNSQVSMKEYRLFYLVRYGSMANTRPLMHLSEKDRKARFNQYDTDNDGVLSASEFSDAIDSGMGSSSEESQKKPSGKPVKNL